MRRRIVKSYVGRSTIGRKEVAIRVNKSGLSANGTQRYVVAIRFTPDSVRKASNNNYVAIEIDDEQKRLYFVTASKEEGYKLTASTSKRAHTSISFTVDDIEEWRTYIGDYDFKKDISDGTYYIDLPSAKGE